MTKASTKSSEKASNAVCHVRKRSGGSVSPVNMGELRVKPFAWEFWPDYVRLRAWFLVRHHCNMPPLAAILKECDRRRTALQVPELLTQVLGHLPREDLPSATVVCKVWNTICTEIRWATTEIHFSAFAHLLVISVSLQNSMRLCRS